MDGSSRFDEVSTAKGRGVTSLHPVDSRPNRKSNIRARSRSTTLEPPSPERVVRRRKANHYRKSPSPEDDIEQDSEARGGIPKLSKTLLETSILTPKRFTAPPLMYGNGGFDDSHLFSNDDFNNDETNPPRSSQHNLGSEPLWFLRLITLFNCDLVPHILFTRASKPSKEWNNNGELVSIDLSCPGYFSPALCDMVDDKSPSWQWGTTSSLKRKERLAELIDYEDGAAKDLEPISKDNYLGILVILMSALPEPWSEIIWEGIEEELWEIIESTYIPLLGVLDMNDIEDFFSKNMSRQRGHYLFALLKMFIRFTFQLGEKTPPNIHSLISQGIDLLEGQWSEVISPLDTDYLHVLRCIAEALSFETYPFKTAAKLKALHHGGSMRSNAAIGFALASLPPTLRPEWRSISPGTPSVMEILAQVELFGTISLKNMPGVQWDALTLDTKVLIAFSETKKKAFADAAEILSHQVSEIEKVYGDYSMETLLSGVVLINCWNSIGKDVGGQQFGMKLLGNAFPNTGICSVIKSTPQVYLSIAIADSLLGQNKFQQGKRLLGVVLEYPTLSANFAMSATLRLLKITRRLRHQASLYDDWERLNKVVKKFDNLSDTLKYECIEETICSLSILEPEDIPRLPQVSDVVRILSSYDAKRYHGSTSSGVNLNQNMEELQRFKNKLNLFSISGPPLYFCRKMRERYSCATVPVVEKVASANWQRSKRIKEMRDTALEVEVDVCPPIGAKSRFDDSGLGSSIGSTVIDQPQGKTSKARSTTSINSFMPFEENATMRLPVPLEDFKGERVCYICEKPVKNIKNESQWRRHVFGDLRPYVCMVENCDADCMRFASRSDFASHLREHQHAKLWKCNFCGYENGERHLVEAHIASTHTIPKDAPFSHGISERSVLRDLSNQKCPFCDKTPGANVFVGHICHHLEEISLAAIPRNGETDDEGASSSSEYLTSRSTESIEMSSPKPLANFTVDEDEPYTIKCICGFAEDDGNTIWCETCDTWQHIECYYPGRVGDASREDFEHSCLDCKPRMMMAPEQAKERDIARELAHSPDLLDPQLSGNITPVGMHSEAGGKAKVFTDVKWLDTKLSAIEPDCEELAADEREETQDLFHKSTLGLFNSQREEDLSYTPGLDEQAIVMRHRGISLTSPANQGRGTESPSVDKSCKMCGKNSASNDSVDCAVCQNTYHMSCVNPRVLRKPSPEFAWACGPCSKRRGKGPEIGFRCDFDGCSRVYTRKFELHRHRKTHLGSKDYSCRFLTCPHAKPNGFRRKDHLKEYLRQVHRVTD